MTTKKSVKKMYCRMFQSVMKAGISTIPWRTPKLMKGAGAVRHLPAAIKRRGLKKALIVTGPTLIGRGLLDGVLEEMEEQGLLYVIYNKVEQNPTDENVEDAVKVFLENGCDCMLALGGGAPLDCAKAVGARIKTEQTDKAAAGVVSGCQADSDVVCGSYNGRIRLGNDDIGSYHGYSDAP